MAVKEMAASNGSPPAAWPHNASLGDVNVTEEPLAHQPVDSGRRRMPEHISRNLIRVQGGKLYLPAAYRIAWFRDECPDWGISTTLVEGGFEAGFATVKAEIFSLEGRLIASDYKTESRQDFPAGWVEKATTGAIARALSLVGFGTQFSPELEETERLADSPQAGRRLRFAHGRNPAPRSGSSVPSPAGDVWTGPGQCPQCHAPAGKRHVKPCVN